MEEATCNTCSLSKPLVEMLERKTRKGLSFYSCCLKCHKARIKRYYNNNRQARIIAMKLYNDRRVALEGGRVRQRGQTKWVEAKAFLSWLKEAPCRGCQKTFPSYVMDFDHVHGEKLFGISQVIGHAVSADVLWEEIQKCEIVCSNCHRIRTYNRKHGILQL